MVHRRALAGVCRRGPGGEHLSFDDCRRAIDRLVEVEGRPEVLQLSGGEPTIHPEFREIVAYACSEPIDLVMINTNGLRLAHDDGLLEALAEHGRKIEIYMQFDGFDDTINQRLRGEPLVEIKLRALEKLGHHGLRATLVTTLQPGVNEDQIGRIVQFGLERPWITGVCFQPATYSGRHVLPEMLEARITFPDVIRAVVEQTDGLFQIADFMPLPCAHPNCHSLTYAYRHGGRVTPLTRFIDIEQNFDLLANGILLNRPRARLLIEKLLGRMGCCAGGDCGTGSEEPAIVQLDNPLPFRAGPGEGQYVAAVLPAARPSPCLSPQGSGVPKTPLLFREGPGEGQASNGQGHAIQKPGTGDVAAEFFTRALGEELSSADIFRITITSFLDAYNFDVRRVMKCCIHHVLPSGHVIPFCAYNVLYRNGHVPLPVLMHAAPLAAE